MKKYSHYSLFKKLLFDLPLDPLIIIIFLKINAMYQSYEVITANVYCHIIPHDFISVLRLSEDQDSGGLLLLCMWGPPAQRRPRQNLCRHGAGHD